jgi:hypothetical protein
MDSKKSVITELKVLLQLFQIDDELNYSPSSIKEKGGWPNFCLLKKSL